MRMEKLEEGGEKQAIAARHAKYFASLLGRLRVEHLGNVRVALSNGLSAHGEPSPLPSI